jgi:flagellum-specific peptidoglycan hydrolase FlgJ
MQPISRPWWEQVTALVSLSVSGALTGFSFVPKAPAELKSPSGMPIHLLALEKAAQPAQAGDAALRSAIINVTNYFLRMAANKTPAQMEAIIWHHDSIDGVDHGESCAAFASLTLELAAQAVGQQSWVTGGTSYPWPLHKWADVRVDPNPGSLGIVSVLQDAEAHHRWHPLGDGYTPRPGDWVLFDGHVEVVTKYANGVLNTVGGDSLPNFSVNAHSYPGPLAAQGVAGFVNNGQVSSMGGATPGSGEAVSVAQGNHHPRERAEGRARIPGAPRGAVARPKVPHRHGDAAVPGLPVPAPRLGGDGHSASHHHPAGRVEAHKSHPGHEAARGPDQAAQSSEGQPRTATVSNGAGPGAAAIPGLPAASVAPQGRGPSQGPPAAPTGVLSTTPPRSGAQGHRGSPYGRHLPPVPAASAYSSRAEQVFINEVAPWAMAAQRRYGVPASVTIAQAIDESGWGQSALATRDHNLFGIKGTGPAGSDVVPTREYQAGQLVSQASAFRVYHNIAESVDDHGKLLATSQYYRQAMAERRDPNAFAAALTGVYATDPQYGTKLIGLMQRYDLYRYDTPAPASTPHRAPAGPRSRAAAPKPTVHHSSAGTAPTRTPAPAPHTPDPTPTPHSTTPAPAPSARPHTVTPVPMPRATTPSVAPRTPAGSAPRTAPPGGAGRTAAPRSAPRVSAPHTPPGHTQAPPGKAGGTDIPGMPVSDTSAQVGGPQQAHTSKAPAAAAQLDAYQSAPAAPAGHAQPRREPSPLDWQKQRIASRRTHPSGQRYQQHIPPSVWTALITTARGRLAGEEPLYRDVARHTGIPWELLAACDWMQCKARAGYSAVQGEKLGTVNADGTVYHTKSEALAQCAEDLTELAGSVYQIDLGAPGDLSVCELANVFAAFRWGGLLQLHHTSAMEFPYSVAGLTAQHTSMRWPKIDVPNAPDKPGSRFRLPFGAVPVVLSLNYPATL